VFENGTWDLISGKTGTLYAARAAGAIAQFLFNKIKASDDGMCRRCSCGNRKFAQ
jgi:hypothetical protein